MQELRRIRKERGLTQRGLADASGVDPATISLIETGKRRPHLETLDSLALVLGVEVVEFFPKVQASLWPEEEPGRRADVYEPWAEFVNRFAERWEQKIAGGVLDHGAVMEFADVLGDLAPVLGRLGLEEKQEQPAEYPNTLGPVAGGAINRLLDLLTPLIAAGVKQEGDSVFLARLRRQREQMVSEQDCAESG